MRYIGVDLHKTNFVVCFLNEDETYRLETFPLSKAGINRFTLELSKKDAVAVEVTQNIYYFYDQIKASVSRLVLVDTYRFSVIAKSKKKTDKADALALARFLKLDHLPEVPVPSERVRELRHLLQARETFVGIRTKCKNLGHAAAGEKRHRFAAFGIRARLLPESDCEHAMTYQPQIALSYNQRFGRLLNSIRRLKSWRRK